MMLMQCSYKILLSYYSSKGLFTYSEFILFWMKHYPNLSLLLSEEISNELLERFDIATLAAMPSSNLYRNESVKKHVFFKEYESQVSRNITKLLCNKLILCARVDLQKEFQDGSFARSCLEQIEKRLDKLLEPPPLTKDKPLVIHTEIKKRRGGKRKSKFNQTEAQKLRNRMAFNVPQIENIVFDEVEELGMLRHNSKSASTDKKSKSLPKVIKQRLDRLDKNKTHGIQSLSIDKTQSLELKNPDHPQERKSKWFK
eukprot:NODE_17_length_41373_cov_0.337016.p17 type:complete len:256 gc:universal NODE_17_length_41373_cov_0.337016:3870-4637(+)